MPIASCINAFKLQACEIFGTRLNSSSILPLRTANVVMKPLAIEARANQRTESAKIRNRRSRKKLNGTAERPRLSVFCSNKQLYAMLVDDQSKKCLFYGSTLQVMIARRDTSCTTAEAAELVGEELVKTCADLKISEISSYDRNGLAIGERMQAFELAIGRHGFLMR